MKDSILDEYGQKKELYRMFEETIVNLLRRILGEVPVQQINGRIKEFDSLEKKIERKNKYSRLDDITDVIGIRIITYLPDSVDLIVKKIRNEFAIDESNSVDKRVKEFDKFGYLSVHLVCELNEDRLKLSEYKKFKGIKFEIQVRSILQHAWAEIEHDIGYKSEIDIPTHLKRRFFRLSSLLELADEEFQNIVDDIDKYVKDIESNFKEKSEQLELNKNTLAEFIEMSDDLKYIQNEICKTLKCNSNEYMDSTNISILLNKLIFIGYTTIGELEEDIEKLKNEIIEFCINFNRIYYQEEMGGGSFSIIVGIFYLVYMKLVKFNEERQAEYIAKFNSKDSGLLDVIKKAYIEMGKDV